MALVSQFLDARGIIGAISAGQRDQTNLIKLQAELQELDYKSKFRQQYDPLRLTQLRGRIDSDRALAEQRRSAARFNEQRLNLTNQSRTNAQNVTGNPFDQSGAPSQTNGTATQRPVQNSDSFQPTATPPSYRTISTRPGPDLNGDDNLAARRELLQGPNDAVLQDLPFRSDVPPVPVQTVDPSTLQPSTPRAVPTPTPRPDQRPQDAPRETGVNPVLDRLGPQPAFGDAAPTTDSPTSDAIRRLVDTVNVPEQTVNTGADVLPTGIRRLTQEDIATRPNPDSPELRRQQAEAGRLAPSPDLAASPQFRALSEPAPAPLPTELPIGSVSSSRDNGARGSIAPADSTNTLDTLANQPQASAQPTDQQLIGQSAQQALLGNTANDTLQYRPSNEPYTRDSAVSIIREEAIKRGIDPDIALRVAESEGLNANPADGFQSNFVKDGKREPSYGPFQLYTAGGLGNEFQERTGLHPGDPTALRAGIQFSLDHAAQNGWGAWYGAKRVGLGPRDGLQGAASPQQTGARTETGSIQSSRPLSNPTLSYTNQGATRNRKTVPRLESILTQGASGVPGIGRIEIFSGGQAAKGSGGARTGSVRHDHGNSADIRVYDTQGRQLRPDNAQHQATLGALVERWRSLGATGIGAGPGYMGGSGIHVGFGSDIVWGAGGRSKNAPAWLRAAHARGASGQVGSPPTQLASGTNQALGGSPQQFDPFASGPAPEQGQASQLAGPADQGQGGQQQQVQQALAALASAAQSGPRRQTPVLDTQTPDLSVFDIQNSPILQQALANLLQQPIQESFGGTQNAQA